MNGRAMECGRSCIDEVGYGLGLEEVQLTVQDGATGELARESDSGSGDEKRVEHPLGSDVATVGADLQGVFACEARGCAKHRHERAVEELRRVRVTYFGEVLAPGDEQVAHPRQLGREPVEQGYGEAAAHTNERDSPSPWRGGYRRDRILKTRRFH
jgi:hypothetical protein